MRSTIWETIGNGMLIFFLLAVAILLLYFLWRFPIRYISAWKKDLPSKDVLSLENDYRSTLAQIVGGLIVLLGLFFTTNEFFNTRRAMDIERRSKESERFTRAIELLGNNEILKQTGGAFALESIAETDPDDYRWATVNVFAAFIKTNRSASGTGSPTVDPSVAPTPSNLASPTPGPSVSPGTTPTATPQLASSPTPLAVRPMSNASRDLIQEMLSFIGKDEKNPSPDIPLNLSLTDLRNFDMRGGHFEFVNFRGLSGFAIDFTGAYLKRADFQHSDQPYNVSNLKCGKFNAADLDGARFNGANLQGVRFNKAKLSKNTTFDQADLTGANFQGTDLSQVERLTQAQIDSAMLDASTILPSYVQNTEKSREPKIVPCNP